MCFSIDKNNPDPKIAEKNIICYKIVDILRNDKHHVSSLYHQYEYVIGELNEHVELVIKFPEDRLKNLTKSFNGMIDRGYHSYCTKTSAMLHIVFPHELLVRCAIPEGTKYYYDSLEKEYVSETIIIDEIVLT